LNNPMYLQRNLSGASFTALGDSPAGPIASVAPGKAASRRRGVKPPALPKTYPCTDCDGDATIGYGKGWDGKVKNGERLCTRCFSKRGGPRIF
jgi:hypothetical protein